MLYMCTVGLKWNPGNFFCNKVSWNTLPWRTFLKLCGVMMKKRSFSFPTPSKQLHELPAGNNKHPNFEWGGEGEGCIWFCSPEYLIWGRCVSVIHVSDRVCSMGIDCTAVLCMNMVLFVTKIDGIYTVRRWNIYQKLLFSCVYLCNNIYFKKLNLNPQLFFCPS